MATRRSFTVTMEIWVKPLFRKARPKIVRACWLAESYEDLLRFLQKQYEGKRWTLLNWSEDAGERQPR